MKTIGRIKTNILSMGCFAVLLSFSSGCGKDDAEDTVENCFGGNWAERYAAELEVYANAVSVYNETPTPANCASYKTAAKNYLDALRSIVDCVPTISRAEINASINEAKAEVDREGCD
ncbi:hypothetical protein [Maribacter sp. 2307ULW6-5]|uniref:hypothetical protein n=1 Tax=Maribacter sp. 2307ULW6-5 TaxID=3386275 RepID=UPI0039BD07A4